MEKVFELFERIELSDDISEIEIDDIIKDVNDTICSSETKNTKIYKLEHKLEIYRAQYYLTDTDIEDEKNQESIDETQNIVDYVYSLIENENDDEL